MSRVMTIFVLLFLRFCLRYGIENKDLPALFLVLNKIFRALQIGLVIIASYDILYQLFRQSQPYTVKSCSLNI